MFTFRVEGQPLTWNRAYRQKTVTVTDRHGQAVLGPSGRPKTHPAQYKTRDAEVYQEAVYWLCKAAIPAFFHPSQVIVAYAWYLERDIDCDNAMKLTNDAIARAIQLDDRNFLSVSLEKHAGWGTPYTDITLYDANDWRVSIVPKHA